MFEASGRQEGSAHTPRAVSPPQGKGRITYLCAGVPDRPFPPTPGLWFSNQPHEVQDVLFGAYQQNPYPSQAELQALGARVNAPSTVQVRPP